MYKVVIIDDEPIIVEGLSRLLPWEQYHCRIAATVHDRGTESRISGYGDQHSDRFQGIAHFSRVFKKNEGISANEYRNTKIT